MSTADESTIARKKPTIEPIAYTVTQVAQRWGCSESHVRNLIEDGELPHFRLGGKLIRIKKEEIEKWETNTQSGATPWEGSTVDGSPSGGSKTEIVKSADASASPPPISLKQRSHLQRSRQSKTD